MERRSVAAWICVAAGLTGAFSGLLLAVIEPAVEVSRFSYPLSATAFVGVQVWFGVHHVGLLVGLLALRSGGVLPSSRSARIGWWIAVVGMIGLIVTEFAAVSAASAPTDSGVGGALGAAYGLDTLLLGLGLTWTGLTIWRSGPWTGWRRAAVLVCGGWVFVVLFPVLILWPTDGSRLAIGGWMLLFAALGVALLEPARRPIAQPA